MPSTKTPSAAQSDVSNHTLYDNYFLSKEIEDQYLSKLNLNGFCTIDNTLEGGPGFIKRIMTYSATDAAQQLIKGQGNTDDVTVGYTERAYTVKLMQTRFSWYDEDEMNDPMLVPVGTQHIGVEMFNIVNDEIYAEWMKGSQTLNCATNGFNFDAFVDARAMFEEIADDTNGEPQLDSIFAICSPSDVASIRKKLKDSLQYVEGYVRTGYIGHVNGIPLIVKKNATKGVIVMATKKAVTIFNKKGTVIERPPRSRDEANIRRNTIYSRRYYIAALTDDTQVVLMYTGAAKPTTSGTDPNGTYNLTDGTHLASNPS